MNRLKGKRALITGGTTGIGLETARQFVCEGARVAITGSNPATLEAARSDLGKDVLVLASDAGDPAAQGALAKTVAEAFGQLDLLFVNAGIVDMRLLGNWSEEAFDRSFGINFKGPFFLIQQLLPAFANPASVILDASINAHIGMPNTAVYSASKAALLSLAKTLSGEPLGRGIRVNAFSPGPIRTPLLDKTGMTEDERKAVVEGIRGQIPVGRFGEPSEIAKVVVFFASDESAFTVGSELVIDGGMSTL